jgi:hypothetical protein
LQRQDGFAIAPNERSREIKVCSNIRVILRPSATADAAQLPHHRKESELSLSEMWLCADEKPQGGFPSQNDVKFSSTHSVKSFAELFQKRPYPQQTKTSRQTSI